MAGRRKKPTPTGSIELRLLRWLFLLLAWRLPRLAFRILAWLIGGLVRLWPRRDIAPEPADSFYRSYPWRKLRVAALEANRARYGLLACECCGMIDAEPFHVDHIYPRSTHPDLALDPDNLQVLCDDCNIGKGTDYTTNWRGGGDPVPVRRRGWRRFFSGTPGRC
jgi:hypothetical protein